MYMNIYLKANDIYIRYFKMNLANHNQNLDSNEVERLLAYWTSLHVTSNCKLDSNSAPSPSISSLILTPIKTSTIVESSEKLINSPYVDKFMKILSDYNSGRESNSSSNSEELYTSFDTFASFIQAFSSRAELDEKMQFIINILGNCKGYFPV